LDGFLTTKEAGLGTDLSISRSIIEAYGGRVCADNQARHGGARFTFSLPAVSNINALPAAETSSSGLLPHDLTS